MKKDDIQELGLDEIETIVFGRQPRKAYLMWKVIQEKGSATTIALADQMAIQETTVSLYLCGLVFAGALVREGDIYRPGLVPLSHVAVLIKEPKSTMPFFNDGFRVTMTARIIEVRLGMFGNGTPCKIVRAEVLEADLQNQYEPPAQYTQMLVRQGRTWKELFSALGEVTVFEAPDDNVLQFTDHLVGEVKTFNVKQGRYLYFKGWAS